MISAATRETEAWRLVRFPSPDQRREFCDQVRLWNQVDGLPPIEIQLANDGSGLRILTEGPGRKNILRLIDAFGGNPLLT